MTLPPARLLGLKVYFDILIFRLRITHNLFKLNLFKFVYVLKLYNFQTVKNFLQSTKLCIGDDVGTHVSVYRLLYLLIDYLYLYSSVVLAIYCIFVSIIKPSQAHLSFSNYLSEFLGRVAGLKNPI